MRKTPIDPSLLTEEQARKIAVDLLSRRDHCRLELLQKLQQRGFSTEQGSEAVAYCVENLWLNEASYARGYVRQRASKGYGEVRIRQELQQREISDEDIANAFAELEQEHELDWFESAKQVRQKRFGVELPQEMKLRQKQQAYLYRRGFSSEQIRYACSDESE